MSFTIPLEIPKSWLDGLEEDPSLLVQEVIQLGIHQWKVRRAVDMYHAGIGSLGYVAEK